MLITVKLLHVPIQIPPSSLSYTSAANLASESGVQAGWGVKDMDDGSLTVAWRQPKGYIGPTPKITPESPP